MKLVALSHRQSLHPQEESRNQAGRRPPHAALAGSVWVWYSKICMYLLMTMIMLSRWFCQHRILLGWGLIMLWRGEKSYDCLSPFSLAADMFKFRLLAWLGLGRGRPVNYNLWMSRCVLGWWRKQTSSLRPLSWGHKPCSWGLLPALEFIHFPKAPLL